MKYKVLFIPVLAVLASCNQPRSSKKTFTVIGTITGNPGKMIYLFEAPIAARETFIMDSSAIGKDGNFSLHTDKKEAAAYILRIDNNEYPVTALINDTDAITLNVTYNKNYSQIPETYEVKGSPASSRLKEFMTALTKSEEALYVTDKNSDSLSRLKIKDSALAALRQEREHMKDSLKDYVLSAITQSNNPALTMFELGNYQSIALVPGYKLDPFTDEDTRSIVNGLVKKFPDHEGLTALKRILDEQAGSISGSWIGKQAVDFALPDPNGNVFKISSFRGKYLLVDFWASWCVPCRMENPNVVKAYNRFKNKNFTILGVSLDTDKTSWLKAVKDDHLVWTQISELKGWDSQPVSIYNFGQEGIPYNILVDPQGKIIGERLRGEELEQKLVSVLK